MKKKEKMTISQRLVVIFYNYWKKTKQWQWPLGSSSSTPYGENTWKQWHAQGLSASSIIIEKKRRRWQGTLGSLSFLVMNEKKKQEDDNEPNSSLSYVIMHEENKVEDDNKPGGRFLHHNKKKNLRKNLEEKCTCTPT